MKIESIDVCVWERQRYILGSFSPFISCARIQISPNFGMINLPSFTFLFLTFAVGLNSEFYSLNLDSFFLFLFFFKKTKSWILSLGEKIYILPRALTKGVGPIHGTYHKAHPICESPEQEYVSFALTLCMLCWW